jgi:hypothetical protein
LGAWNASDFLLYFARIFILSQLHKARVPQLNGGAIKKNGTFYYAAFEQAYQRGQDDSIIDPSFTSLLNDFLATETDLG